MSPVPMGDRPRRSRELLSDGVRRRILQAILDGTLVSGERLHDEELIAWLGVSRTPIRSALERLAEVGLVEMEPNRFTRVAHPTRIDLVDALEVYSCLHCAAAETIVPDLSDDDLARFRERVERMTALVPDGSDHPWGPDELSVVNDVASFFTRESGNPSLVSALGEIEMRLLFYFRSIPVPIGRADLDRFAVDVLAGAIDRDGVRVSDVLGEFLGKRVVAAKGVGGRG